METLTISGTDLQVSRIGLGTWAMGGRLWGGTDDASAIRTVQAALDQGISLIDSAPAYGYGHAEEIVGQAIHELGRRDQVVLATKAGLQWSEQGSMVRNATPERLTRELDDSLRRLQTDYIDLYQLHWPDPLVPIEQTAETLSGFYQAGKIRAIGVSNVTPAQCEIFREVAPLHSLQPPYNLFERGIDEDILHYAEQTGLTLLTYGALCRGLLSGKIDVDTPFNGDDLRNKDPKFQAPRFAQYLGAVADLHELAVQRHGRSVLALAVRWILDRSPHIVALWGARRPDQLEAIQESMGWHLSEDDMKDIDSILAAHITDPIGPDFMAPPARTTTASDLE